MPSQPNTIKSDTITMVGVDGGVRVVPFHLKDSLLKQGWGIVTNPKQTYYPQFDRTLKGYGKNPEEIGEEDKDYMEVEKI